ncbi:unnamed protein product [Microthlaspi erraticum]|uniref:Integrase catalytic domain-containing protein n=1 Tax=Microthlaspi erraticum TaxID=1685480 RepID=A0A6D2KL96_9BRAS|nr:unnamed protein product [Microthlaspi erraticum]
MKMALKVHRVWEAIESEEAGTNADKNNMAMALLCQSIPETPCFGYWRNRHGKEGVGSNERQACWSRKGRLSEITSQAAALGESIEEIKIVKKFLKSLPHKKFITIVASLEQILDLNKTSFSEIIGRLKAYEERVNGEEDTQEEQNKLMSLCFKLSRSFARSFAQTQLLKLQEAQEKETEVNDTEVADKLMLHEVVYLNEGKVVPSKYETNNGEDNVWYLDNGASNHMTGDKRYFSKIDESITGKVRFGDDSRIDIKGKGLIEFIDGNGEPRKMNDVYFIPDLKSNIISLGQETEARCDVRMKGEQLTMHDRDGKLLVKAARSKNRLYKVNMGLKDGLCLYTTTTSVSSRWHARLGHINLEKMKGMMQRELVTGVPSFEFEKKLCGSCLLGKQTRQVFPQATTYRASKVLELIHGDLCGPITPHTAAGNKYIFVLIDDHSRYMWSILLREKSEALEKFKRFKKIMEQESGASIQVFRTESGGEFVSQEFNAFCEISRIKRHLTAPYTPQQNGVVERRNRTLLEMTRSILKHMFVPDYLWGEAIRHSTYLLNRIATRAVKDKTPYEIFRGKKVETEHKPSSRTEPGSKAYRLVDPQTRRIVVSRDVIFDESKGWNWKTSGGEQSRGQEYGINFGDFGVHESQENDENLEREKKGEESHDEEDESSEEDEASSPEIEGFDDNQVNLRRGDRERTRPKYLDDYILLAVQEGERLLLTINEEPRDFSEAKKAKEWVLACEEIRSIIKNNTWTLVYLPSGAKAIGLKWVFKLKRNSDGSINKHKARLVAKGYAQRYGVDYEEVFAPVARLETIRLLISLAAASGWEIHHLDVKTAFLHGDLKETVFVKQPEGFEEIGQEEKVCKLNKALYGLKQAPRAWNIKLNAILREFKFSKCLKEPTVYRREYNGNLLLVAVYVDDLLVTGTSLKDIEEFKAEMASKFEMSDLGKQTYYLGIEVYQHEEGITLRQERYALKILEEAQMKSCNTAQIPMELGCKLSKAEDEKDIDATSFRKNVGCFNIYFIQSQIYLFVLEC